MKTIDQTLADLDARMDRARTAAVAANRTTVAPAPETRADVTDRVARSIIDAEATARAENTARLRAARLAQRDAADASGSAKA